MLIEYLIGSLNPLSDRVIERLDRNYFYRKPPRAQRAGLGGNA